METDQVLDEYRKGDADKRMSLFLYHRELRDAFDRIEQDDPLGLFTARQASRPAEQGPFRTFIVMLREHISRLGSQASFDRKER